MCGFVGDCFVTRWRFIGVEPVYFILRLGTTLYCMFLFWFDEIMYLMVRKIIHGHNYYISLIRYFDDSQQHFDRRHPFPHEDFVLFTSCSSNSRRRINMREEPYNDLLLNYVEHDIKKELHIKPIQFVHEWGSVSSLFWSIIYFLYNVYNVNILRYIYIIAIHILAICLHLKMKDLLEYSEMNMIFPVVTYFLS